METSTHQQHYQASTKVANYTKPAATLLLASLFCLSALLLPRYSFLLPAVHSLVELLCINMNKNYMFLLFNGILVILKISRCVGSSPEGSDLHGVSSNARYYDSGTKEKEVHEPSTEMIKEVISLEEKEAECKEENSLVVLVEEEESTVTEEVEGGQQENGNGNGNGNTDEDETGLMMSTEEWNRKFEDFIRKMREGIKTEAAQSNLGLSWKVDQQL